MTQHETFRLLKDLKQGPVNLRTIKNVNFDFFVDADGLRFEDCLFKGASLTHCFVEGCTFEGSVKLELCTVIESRLVDARFDICSSFFKDSEEQFGKFTVTLEGFIENQQGVPFSSFEKLYPKWEIEEYTLNTITGRRGKELMDFNRYFLWRDAHII